MDVGRRMALMMMSSPQGTELEFELANAMEKNKSLIARNQEKVNLSFSVPT